MRAAHAGELIFDEENFEDNLDENFSIFFLGGGGWWMVGFGEVVVVGLESGCGGGGWVGVVVVGLERGVWGQAVIVQ